MDWFLTEGVDQDEKKSIEENMIKLVDLYYWALDGHKVSYTLMLSINFISLFFVYIWSVQQKKIQNKWNVQYPIG